MDGVVEFEENVDYDQLEHPDKFHVTIIDNPSAKRCNLKGEYEFHINTENFAIIDKIRNRRLYTWPFRYVRRYGKSSTNFQFEAGRKCQSGEGLFSIQTNEGDSEEIFDLVQTRFNFIKQRDREFKGIPPIPADNKKSSHRELPPRQYENSEVLSAPQKIEPPLRLTKSTKSKAESTKPKAASVKSEAASKPAKSDAASKPAKSDEGLAAKASRINLLIGQNKDTVANSFDDPENTYSVMGREAPSDNGLAQYSAVYSQKPAAAYTGNEDSFYDEVRM